MLGVRCHVSGVTCHFFFFFFSSSFFFTKWRSLSGEGLLSTGPTPSSLSLSLTWMSRVLEPSLAWRILAEQSVKRYSSLEQEAGHVFYHEVSRRQVVRGGRRQGCNNKKGYSNISLFSYRIALTVSLVIFNRQHVVADCNTDSFGTKYI